MRLRFEPSHGQPAASVFPEPTVAGASIHGRTAASGEHWAYSDSPSDGDYWVRRVSFDSSGRVSEVAAELYVD